MSPSRNNKDTKDLDKKSIASKNPEKSNKVEKNNEFDLIKDYEEGLELFLENENYDSPEEAIEDVKRQLDLKVKPKLNFKNPSLPKKTSP